MVKIKVQYIPTVVELVYYHCGYHDNCIFLRENDGTSN